MSEQVSISLISAISGIIIAYIVNVAAKRVQKKKEKRGEPDRIDQMFDSYERLIKQKDIEDDRKARIVIHLESELTKWRDMYQSLEESLEDTKKELRHSRRENKELERQLGIIRDEYHDLQKTNKEVQ